MNEYWKKELDKIWSCMDEKQTAQEVRDYFKEHVEKVYKDCCCVGKTNRGIIVTCNCDVKRKKDD